MIVSFNVLLYNLLLLPNSPPSCPTSLPLLNLYHLKAHFKSNVSDPPLTRNQSLAHCGPAGLVPECPWNGEIL